MIIGTITVLANLVLGLCQLMLYSILFLIMFIIFIVLGYCIFVMVINFVKDDYSIFDKGEDEYEYEEKNNL